MLGVNRQVYYRSHKSSKTKQKVAVKVVGMIEKVRVRMPKLGTRKLYHILNDELKELGVGRDRLFAIMRANHLQIIPKRQYHVTTDSHHRFKKHRNLVESLIVERPEQLWVADITYIGTRTCPMYLSLVTDAYSKKIVGVNLSESLHATGALSALKEALKQRKYPNKPLIHHSDRGLQYCCDQYQKVLNKNKILCSMTEQYDPYQNAIAERVNGIVKQEFIQGILINDLNLMTKLVRQAVAIYNNERPHLSCELNTPAFMHNQATIKIKTYKK